MKAVSITCEQNPQPAELKGYVVALSGRNGIDFARVKYWTGQMLEGWPVYLSEIDKAHRLTKQSAKEVLAGFRSRGFSGRVMGADRG